MRRLGNIVNFFAIQRNIFGVCPHCQELFRLSDIKISYRKKFARDWYGNLEKQEEKIDDERMNLEETLAAIREKAQELARQRHLPRMLRQVDPVFTPLGYYPQDVKAVFDPMDFVIFDGMNRAGKVKRIVFMDEYNTDERIRRIQSSIENAISKERYGFQSIRLTKDGRIQSQ